MVFVVHGAITNYRQREYRDIARTAGVTTGVQMKTLDEVITGLEYCTGFDFVRCQDCPGYSEPDCGVQNDALHYLKELKEAREILAKAREEAYEQIEDFKTDVLSKMSNNDPLTWDELKQMEGKPIWIEADNGQEQFKHWFIIDEFTLSDIPGIQIMWCMNNCFKFWEQDLGKTWQAYRKERK